jgi:predicted Fe-Mo cluster-binding NifX family protein
MKIAIPIAGGRLSAHFGHCEHFDLVEVDLEKKAVLQKTSLPAPPHQPGLLPSWLAGKGAGIIIAGGMGMRAQQLFGAQGIQVVVGAPSDTSENIVRQYLEGSLLLGENTCDH